MRLGLIVYVDKLNDTGMSAQGRPDLLQYHGQGFGSKRTIDEKQRPLRIIDHLSLGWGFHNLNWGLCTPQPPGVVPRDGAQIRVHLHRHCLLDVTPGRTAHYPSLSAADIHKNIPLFHLQAVQDAPDHRIGTARIGVGIRMKVMLQPAVGVYVQPHFPHRIADFADVSGQRGQEVNPLFTENLLLLQVAVKIEHSWRSG